MFHKTLEHLPQEGAKCAMVLSTDHEVCAVFDSTLTPRTASDYARLFAAAPQLLAACRLLLGQIANGKIHAYEVDLDENEVSAFDAIEAAVKAAEGGE